MNLHVCNESCILARRGRAEPAAVLFGASFNKNNYCIVLHAVQPRMMILAVLKLGTKQFLFSFVSFSTFSSSCSFLFQSVLVLEVCNTDFFQ